MWFARVLPACAQNGKIPKRQYQSHNLLKIGSRLVPPFLTNPKYNQNLKQTKSTPQLKTNANMTNQKTMTPLEFIQSENAANQGTHTWIDESTRFKFLLSLTFLARLLSPFSCCVEQIVLSVLPKNQEALRLHQGRPHGRLRA